MSTLLLPSLKRSKIKLKRILYYILYPLQRTYMEFRVHHKYGPKKITYNKDELILLCLFLNGEKYLEKFIQYHLSLGIKHIFFVDNGSTDNSPDIIRKFDHVTLYNTDLIFKKYESKIRNFLFNKFSKNRWGLYLDIDEFFDFPFSDQINLNCLLKYFNKNSYTAVIGQMLDLFSKKQISQMNKDDDSLFRDEHIYYDLTHIKKINYKDHQISYGNFLKNEKIKFFSGGIRSKLFNTDVFLTKHPLIYNSWRVIPFINPHKSLFVKIADISVVIYHYKFLSNFIEFTSNAVKFANYTNNSADYRAYFEVIGTDKNINLFSADSKILKSVNQLIEDDFLTVSSEYLQWVKEHGIH